MGARWVVLWPEADRAVVPFLRAVGYRAYAQSGGTVLMRLGPPVPSALAAAPPPLRFCTGFEQSGSVGGHRLIAPQGTLELGPAAGRRRAAVAEAQARSRAGPRRLVIRLDGRVLLDRSVGTGPTPLRLRVPAGEGAARMTIEATPGPTPGSEVVLSDVRVR